ncbi:MAG: hypothetical protein R3F37_16670 [Candidatus Competibacteraceae bacterium]
MNANERFFDTNILLYLLSSDGAKADRAEQLIATGGVISVQVLNEFAARASAKLGNGLARDSRGAGHGARDLPAGAADPGDP